MQNRPVYEMTAQGFQDLKAEKEKLTKRRPQVVINLSNAREQGDLSENAGYHAAKEELGWIDSRLREISHMIKFSKISTGSTTGQISLGNTVTIKNAQLENTFTIVSAMEADPAKSKISDSSPIGAALIGKKIGQEVTIDMPVGKITYKILEIK